MDFNILASKGMGGSLITAASEKLVRCVTVKVLLPLVPTSCPFSEIRMSNPVSLGTLTFQVAVTVPSGVTFAGSTVNEFSFTFLSAAASAGVGMCGSIEGAFGSLCFGIYHLGEWGSPIG